MIKKIFFLGSLVLISNLFYSRANIPVNSSENKFIKKWVVAKIENLNNDSISNLTLNTQDFLKGINQNNVREINLSKNLKSSISFYQLFDSIDYKTTFIATCIVEFDKAQLCGLSWGSYMFNQDIYVNGKKINSQGGSDVDFKFKKGGNIILIVGKSYGTYESIVSFNIKNPNMSQLKLKVINEDGNPHSFGYFKVKGDKISITKQLDKNGEKKLWLKPGDYKIISSNNDNYIWSNTISLDENEIHDEKLIISKKSIISGKVFTIDKKTPQQGIQIKLLDDETKKVFVSTLTDIDGNYKFLAPLGKWNIQILENDEYQFHQSNGKRTVIEINSKSNKIENLNFNISKQINGSWDKITMFDGMLSPSVLKTMVSKEDLLYIGTFNGLSIYDGIRIKNYNYENGLPNDPITDIFEDDKGAIWIGFQTKGLVKWKNGDILNHYTKNDGLPTNAVNSISQNSKNGDILIGTNAGFSILKNNYNFENYNFLDGLCNGYTREVKVFGNNIWIGNGSGLAVYNGKKFKPIAYSNEFFNGTNITVIETDSEGNIWLGTQGNGLLKYDGLKFTTYRTEDGLPSNFILDILIDNNGVWIATQKGLVKMKDEKIIGINNPEKDGLKDFIVRSISKSKDGVYFISSSGGIFEYDLNSFKKIMTEQGLKSNEFIFDIKLADNGILWAGGNQGLYKIDNDIVTKIYDKDNSKLENGSVLDLEFSRDGSLWIVQNSKVSRLVNEKIEDLTKLLKIPKSLEVKDIEFDNNGDIWIATTFGLGEFKNDTLIIYNESNGTVQPKTNCAVTIGNNNEIIYSTYGSGFSIFDGENFINYNTENGLSNNNVEEIAVDSKNNYWIALDGGAVQMFDGESFKQHKIKDGVSSDESFTLYVDDLDNVWVGTYGGGVCFYDGNIWNSIDSRDGLHNNTIKSICGSNGNKYWFGSRYGITSYTPKHQTPKIFVEKIETTNKSYNFSENFKVKFIVDEKVSFLLNSNCYNTKKEKQKYIIEVERKGKKIDKVIASNEFVFRPEKTGKYKLVFRSIDRDMNYSNPLSINFSVVGPWYLNPKTAIPIWGSLFLLISFSIYTTRKYISQRRYTLKLKEEAQIKDREARERLEEKNKEILDSINYAKRIQSAILPSNRAVKAYLKNSFVLYKPKDVIAGDFYWLEYYDNKTYFAAADCTGHGVPGAMISLVCNNALNRSVREYNLTDPGKILDNTKELVVEEFGKSDENVKDGMDIALCCIEGDKLKYAGAYNPLWLVRDKKLQKIGADRQPIGSFEYSKPFKSHEIKLKKGDSIYVFSDGFMDQFGGERGKKYKSLKFQDFLLSIQEENMRKQRELLNKEIEEWKGELEQIDDICIMGVRI
jgi:ligand-binding sensor domain-containing protein/serine phosphatase RsbU (regulator of sigma subunit)